MLKIKAPVDIAYPFRIVDKGDIFEFNKMFYMKTEIAKSASHGCQINAINLKSGSLTCFEPECEVYLLDGEMTLVRSDTSF